MAVGIYDLMFLVSVVGMVSLFIYGTWDALNVFAIFESKQRWIYLILNLFMLFFAFVVVMLKRNDVIYSVVFGLCTLLFMVNMYYVIIGFVKGVADTGLTLTNDNVQSYRPNRL